MAASKKTPSRDDLIQELANARAALRFGNTVKVSDAVTPIILSVIRWSAIIVCFYFAYLSIGELAGKQTDALINIKMLLDSNFLGIIFGGGGIIYGVVQKRLKQNVIKRLQPRIQNFEQQLDPNRTSSLLTSGGDTNPADE